PLVTALAPTTNATCVMSEAGAAARSTTLGISDTGMLSITNQPRSSSTSAAVVRPAPERPQITAKSVTDPIVRGGPRFADEPPTGARRARPDRPPRQQPAPTTRPPRPTW